MLVVDGCNPIIVERLQDKDTMEPLWIMGTNLINSKGEQVGRINKEKQVITRWVFEEATATVATGAPKQIDTQ